jgi:hypothetical protein
MVQTAQARIGRSPDRWRQNGFWARRFLAEAETGAVVVIIRRVGGKKPLEVALVQGDDVVEQIAPAACRSSKPRGALKHTCSGLSWPEALN